MQNEIDEELLAEVAPDTKSEMPEINETGAAEIEINELQSLRSEITELRLRLALLSGGAAADRLNEGVRLAAGFMAAEGTEPDIAAEKVLNEYPHIRLTPRTIPYFSAECTGKGDGFAAIRNIFSRR